MNEIHKLEIVIDDEGNIKKNDQAYYRAKAIREAIQKIEQRARDVYFQMHPEATEWHLDLSDLRKLEEE